MKYRIKYMSHGDICVAEMEAESKVQAQIQFYCAMCQESADIVSINEIEDELEEEVEDERQLG